jgi:dipeptidyl aminopeptidase/acylaminoacyl peptidase
MDGRDSGAQRIYHERNAMRRITLLLSVLAAALSAQPKPSATQGLPPLIDRELLFGNPEIAGAQLSPDGKFLAFLKPWKDTRNVWVKRTSEPFSAARLLTTEAKRPVAGYFWSRDGKYILYVKDNDGDENFNLYAVDPAAAVAAGAEAPPSRDLTGLKGVIVQLYSVPKSDPDIAYIGVNDRDKAWHDLYKLKISSGEKTLIRKNTERIAGWVFDLSGQLRLAERIADNGDQDLLRVEASGFSKIYSCSVFESCGAVRFEKDGKRLYIVTNKGDSTDLLSLALLDPASGKVETVESDPLRHVDFGGAVFSEATEELAQTNYTDDKIRRYFKDKSFEADFKWLAKKFPGKEVGVASRTRDERLWLISAFSDTEPGETYLFDRKAKTVTLQFKVREKLPREPLAPMTAIRYKSSDGLEIPAYLTLPKGIPSKNLPTLVVPHGGPWARDGWGYNSMAQFFANRGYAVLMPNFRGSTGYGKKFLNAGNGEWGRKMQDDITWGVQYLIAQGTSDPKRIGILGGSYGGYATLAGVTFTPDLYRAAVDIVGPSNLLTLLEAIPPYWEAARKVMYARMADPGTPDGKKWMEERSPLTYAAKIKTPLFVVQGANDPRVNRSEAERIVIALRDRGFPVEYMVAPDEGHGFARPVNNMAMFMAAEKFLAKYLDGRYQEGGTDEVVKRLAEIMVDPKTVTLTRKVDSASVGVPKPAVDLKPGTYNYQVKLSMGPNQMSLKTSTTIKEENGAWTATEIVESPMGSSTDTAVLEKGTLILRSRIAKQGPNGVELQFVGSQATGKISMGGQEKAISADLGGPLFADSVGNLQSIACLPLADGYTTTFRNFDLQKQKTKLVQLTVSGTESVTVPAGKFEAYKVELTSADGGNDKATLWITKNTRQAVKFSAVMAAMGGATMVSELMP